MYSCACVDDHARASQHQGAGVPLPEAGGSRQQARTCMMPTVEKIAMKTRHHTCAEPARAAIRSARPDSGRRAAGRDTAAAERAERL